MTTSWYLDSPSRFSSSSGESFLSLPSPLAWRSPFDSPVPLSGSFFCVKGPIAEEESLVVCVCARVRVTMLSYPSYFAHGGTSNKAVIRISDWERWPRSSTDEKFPLVVARAMNEEDYRNVLNEIRSVIDDNTPSAFTWLSCCFLGGLVGCYGPCWLDQRARHAEEEVIRYLRRKNRESLWPLGVDISLCKLQHARFFPSPEYWLEATVDPELMRVSESEVRDMRSRLVELESNLERKSKQIDDLQRSVLGIEENGEEEELEEEEHVNLDGGTNSLNLASESDIPSSTSPRRIEASPEETSSSSPSASSSSTPLSKQSSSTLRLLQRQLRYEKKESSLLRRQISAMEDEKLCRICRSVPKNIVFQPCMHSVCCASCAAIVEASGRNICPICRQEIASSFEYFNA